MKIPCTVLVAIIGILLISTFFGKDKISKNVPLILIATKMDYVNNKIESGFVFNNPNEKGRCGCGESFHI